MPNLSLVCVSQLEPHSIRFLKQMSEWCKNRNFEFVLGVDGSDIQVEKAYEFTSKVVPVKSDGYLESVLDDVKSKCSGDYIMRLDDDESMSIGLSSFLTKLDFPHGVYTFSRANLWGDEHHFITNGGLYPDIQTRLFRADLAGGRTQIHRLSPHGFGKVLPLRILHYKFLVKSYEERLEIAKRYETVEKGAGLGEVYKKFNLPEDCFVDLKVLEC